MSRYKLLIFDLDDTLFDYKQTEMQAISKTCKIFNIKFDCSIFEIYKQSNKLAKEEIIDYILNLDFFRKRRAELFLEQLNRRDIPVNKFINYYLKYSEKGVLIEGVYETLHCIEVYRKVVATNGSTYPRKNKLVNSCISPFFSSFYSSEMLGVAKPNPDFFLNICKEENVGVKETLVIGDNFKTDILGAQSAGIDACYIARDNSKYSKILKNVYYLSRIEEIIKVVEN